MNELTHNEENKNPTHVVSWYEKYDRTIFFNRSFDFSLKN